jgi:site-specific DNA recombinase
MQNHKSVGIWIRVSTEDQVKGESPEHHEKRARYYAESKEWNIKEVYRLEAVSGKSVMEHPETKRMLTDVKSGKITGLIFSKLARLARNTKELLDFSEIFRACNADLISLQESIDTSTPAGRLFYTMIAAMAQWEREEIAERVAASVPIRARLGKPLGGQAVYGYKWEDKKLVVDTKEAPVRKLLYELFLEHKRKRTVARLLNKAGYRTRNGSPFSYQTVGRLIQDPTAKGLRRANYGMRKNGRWAFKPESEWIFTDAPAIVSAELWDECNRILNEQREHNKRPTRKAVHLFGGLVICSCGGKMYVPSNSPKYICQKCRNKIGADDLESIYHEQLKNFLFSDEEIKTYFSKANSTLSEKEELLKTLLEEEKKVRTEMENVLRLYHDGKLTETGFGEYHQPLEEQLKQIRLQLPELQAEIDFLKIQHLSSEEVLNEAKDLQNHWPKMNRNEKRQIVENITDRILIGKDDIQINLSYLPTPETMTTESQHLNGLSSPTVHKFRRDRNVERKRAAEVLEHSSAFFR